MDSKDTKYDDITLMQYADGELDDSTRLRLEKDLANNKELQGRLAIFALTRDDLISTKSKLPKHIEDLIDEQDRISDDGRIIRFPDTQTPDHHDNKVVGFFKKYPVQSLAASVMFGLLIGSQGMKSLYTSPYNDVLIKEYQSVSKPVVVEVPAQVRSLTKITKRSQNDFNIGEIRLLLLTLNKDQNTKYIPASKNNQAIKIVSEFTNIDGQQCKLAETNITYLVACLDKSGNWSVYKAE
jgi:hypothetical protein